jgi:hypothetical protein
MKLKKHHKEQILDLLMKSNSLHDLLGILENICKNLDLNYLNPRIKHFRYFQFTFFGLMVKAKGLLEMMEYRAEFLGKNSIEFNEIHFELLKLKKEMESAYTSVKNKNMTEGKNKIIELHKKYLRTFEMIEGMKGLI